jgi:hypothetical protein
MNEINKTQRLQVSYSRTTQVVVLAMNQESWIIQ